MRSKSNLYEVWFDCKSEKEQHERWIQLRNMGYKGSEIYRFNFQGNDGRFHREVFVFNRKRYGA